MSLTKVSKYEAATEGEQRIDGWGAVEGAMESSFLFAFKGLKKVRVSFFSFRLKDLQQFCDGFQQEMKSLGLPCDRHRRLCCHRFCCCLNSLQKNQYPNL